MPDVRVNEVTQIGGIDALDVFHEDCGEVVIILASFLHDKLQQWHITKLQ